MKRVWVLLAALLMSGNAMAQTPEVESLREAAQEMTFLSYFFGNLMQGTTEDEIADNYRAMSESTQAFLRVAAEPYRGRALRAAQAVFKAAKLPAPDVLHFAVVAAEHRRDSAMTAALCSALARVFAQAAANMDVDGEPGSSREMR